VPFHGNLPAISRRHCVPRRGSRESERGKEWIYGDDGTADLGSLAMNDFLKTCEAAARAGARELLAWRGRFETREKAPADLVTDADVASQAAIRTVIATRYPDHLFIGEESTTKLGALDTDEHVWLVDPLDGTTNYVHGFPCYAVSVAVARHRELLAGVIYDPLTDECFASESGRGAWRNGSAIHTGEVATVGEALLAVSLPARVKGDSPDLADFVRVVQVCQAIRRTGSAALNLAYVACGRLDGFWATHIHPWDVAAGVLLVREAGGVVTGRDGAEFDLWNPHFASAAGPALHRELMNVLDGSTARQSSAG
jgi:myo-inositol-1(or 4)-monophosphatase